MSDLDAIVLVEADPAWTQAFAREQALLATALAGEEILAIEHIGSTAVAGLIAKPIIDLLLLVRELAVARQRLVPPIEALGYLLWRENPATDRLFLVKGLPPAGRGRTHHVHIAQAGSEATLSLRFRDHLRRHPQDAARYAALKRELAARHRTDREAYTAAKGAFIQEILRRPRP